MAVPKLDFDIVKDLEDAGASQELAKAVVRAIADKTIAELATKGDVAALRTELIETREALRGEIADVRTELLETRESLRAEISEVRESLRAEIAAMRTEMIEKMSVVQTKLIIWLVGTAIASITLVATIGQLLK